MMKSRTKLVLFILLPIVLMAALILFLYEPAYFGDPKADGSHAVNALELNNRMSELRDIEPDADLFTLEDGAIYTRRNVEKLKSFTVTAKIAGEITARQLEGESWKPNMATKLPIGTKLYRVSNQPTLLAVRMEQADIFYKIVSFDR
jgi:hypothetical protein